MNLEQYAQEKGVVYMLQREKVHWEEEEVITLEVNQPEEKYRGDNRVKLNVLWRNHYYRTPRCPLSYLQKRRFAAHSDDSWCTCRTLLCGTRSLLGEWIPSLTHTHTALHKQLFSLSNCTTNEIHLLLFRGNFNDCDMGRISTSLHISYALQLWTP